MFPKIKAIPEKVKETLEMLGMDFSNLDKYKACKYSKDRNKIATTDDHSNFHNYIEFI